MIPLLAAGFGIELLLVLLLLPIEGPAGVLRSIGVFLGAGILHLAVAEMLLGRSWRADSREAGVILAFGLLFRLTVLPSQPALSDDCFRNIWDGRIANAGIDPYAYAPKDEALVEFRDDTVWPGINHNRLPTIYPPTAIRVGQAADLLSRALSTAGIGLAGLSSPLLAWKLILLAVEFGGTVLLTAGLMRRGRGGAAVIFAWAPVLVVEFYESAHVDAAGVGLLGGAIGLYLLGRAGAAGVLAGASLLVKWMILPLALLIPRLRSAKPLLVGLAAAVILLAASLLSSGPPGGGTLREYQANWEFAGVLHRGLAVDSWPGGRAFSRMITVLIVLSLGAWRIRRGLSPAEAAPEVMGLFLMIQPTIHPWYLTWLLPLLALSYRRSLLLWTLLWPLTYSSHLIKDVGVPRPQDLLSQALIFFPILVLFILEAKRRA